jgi:hypothetical protein
MALAALRTNLRQTAGRTKSLLIANLILWSALTLVTTILSQWPSDFAVFYRAGTLLATGRNPYVPFHISSLIGCTARCGITHTFVYPPLVAVLFSGLSHLPYWLAYGLWSGLGVAFIATGSYFMQQVWPVQPRHRVLVYVLCLINPISIWGILLGQFDAFIFAGWMVAWWAAKKGRGRLAGASIALTLVKPQVGIILPFVLIVAYRQQAKQVVIGLLATVLGLGLMQWVIVGSLVVAFFHAGLGFEQTILVRQPDLVSVAALLALIPALNSAALESLALDACTLVGLLACLAWYWSFRKGEYGVSDRFWMSSLLVGLWLLFTPYDHPNDLILLIPLAYWVVRSTSDSFWRGPGGVLALLTPVAAFLSTRQLSFLSGLDNTLLYLCGIYAWLLVAWALHSKATPNIAVEHGELGA